MPKFEEEKDWKNQRQVESCLVRPWAIEIEECPEFSPLDCYGLRRGERVMGMEIKCRNYSMYDFPTFFISQRKVQNAMQAFDPCYLVVRWHEGIFYLRLKPDRVDSVEWGGRKERPGAVNDQEWMAHFKIERFRRV